MGEDRIVIPYNEAGKRCFEVLSMIAMRQLNRARDAADGFINSLFPTAKILEERAMFEGKYIATYAITGGEQQRVIYDYRTKAVELTAA